MKTRKICLSLLLGILPVTCLSAQPIDDFVITVWQPAGWSGGSHEVNENRDVSFTGADRTALNSLGVDLLVHTPSLVTVSWDTKPDTAQALEERIDSTWAGAGGFVVEWAPESDLEDDDNWSLLDYAGCVGTCGGKMYVTIGKLLPGARTEMGGKVQKLVTKWSGSPYAQAFWGYLIGNEYHPDYRAEQTITDSSVYTGGLYDAETYWNMKTVIDSIRAHDTERRILVVGNTASTGTWTLAEQQAFRHTFFLSDDLDYPPNVLINHEYVLWCTSTCESEGDSSVQARMDKATKSMDGAWNLVRAARQDDRKAEWYHKFNVSDQYQKGSNCDQRVPRQPHYRIPDIAEVKAQAYLALARGATGLGYYTYTSQPEAVFSYGGSADRSYWCHGLMRYAAEGVTRAKRDTAFFDSLSAVNDTLHVVGDTLYALAKRAPLSWQEKFTSGNYADSSTYVSDVDSADSADPDSLEFAAFADSAAQVDYLMVVNRWGLYAGNTPQTIALELDTGNLFAARTGAYGYTVEDIYDAGLLRHVTTSRDPDGPSTWINVHNLNLSPGSGHLLRFSAGWRGALAQDTTLTDSVEIDGTFTVPQDVTLRLGSGARLGCEAGEHVVVDGTLHLLDDFNSAWAGNLIIHGVLQVDSTLTVSSGDTLSIAQGGRMQLAGGANVKLGQSARLMLDTSAVLDVQDGARVELAQDAQLKLEREDSLAVPDTSFCSLFQYDLPSGSSLISLPDTVQEDSVSQIFPECIAAWDYAGGGYTVVHTLHPGHGYWVNLSAASDDTLDGKACPVVDTTFASSGWHRIGTAVEGFRRSDIGVSGGSLISIFKYDGVYEELQSNDYLEAGRGYWGNVSADGTRLRLPDSSMVAGKPVVALASVPAPVEGADGVLWAQDRLGHRLEVQLGVPRETLIVRLRPAGGYGGVYLPDRGGRLPAGEPQDLTGPLGPAAGRRQGEVMREGKGGSLPLPSSLGAPRAKGSSGAALLRPSPVRRRDAGCADPPRPASRGARGPDGSSPAWRWARPGPPDHGRDGAALPGPSFPSAGRCAAGRVEWWLCDPGWGRRSPGAATWRSAAR